MKRLFLTLIGILMFALLFSCEVPTQTPTNPAEEDFYIPEFYQALTLSRTIAHPEADSFGKLLESGYFKMAPALIRLKKDTSHKAGDTITSSFLGSPVTIATSKTGDVIDYVITDSDDSLSITMSYNSATKKISYSQKSAFYAADGTIIGSSGNIYDVVYIDMTDAAVGDDLSIQAEYSVLHYKKVSDGSCIIYKSDNIEFCSTAGVNGFVVGDGVQYEGTDPRAVSEVPSTSNFDSIKTTCAATLTASGTEQNEYLALWYQAGVIGIGGELTGHNTEAALSAALPWTTALTYTYKYTVSIDPNNGDSVVKTPGVAKGSTITRPTNPAKAGFSFAGWFTDYELTVPWSFSADTVTENMTLYAKWTTASVFTVSFNTDGGGAVDDITDVEDGSIITAPAPPSKSGFTFAGWFKDAGLTDDWVFATDTVTENRTLYAKWKAPDVYIAGTGYNGTNYIAKYWKNGTETILSDEEVSVVTTSIAVDGSDVYVTGYSMSGGPWRALYWVNGIEHSLTDGPNNAAANSVKIHGSDVYICGMESDGTDTIAKYWKNGIEVILPSVPSFTTAKDIAIDGSDVHVVGSKYVSDTINNLIYWKNGIVQDIPLGDYSSRGTSICISDSNVYITGTESNGSFDIAKVWINGTPTALTDGPHSADAYSVSISGSDVYVGGIEYDGTDYLCKYWKNGSENTPTAPIFNTSFPAAPIQAIGTDIYFCAAEKTGPATTELKYWKNGVENIVITGFAIQTSMIIVP